MIKKAIYFMLSTVAVSFLCASALADEELKVNHNRIEDFFKVELGLVENFPGDKVHVEYIRETIQINYSPIAKSYDKKFIPIDDPFVKSLYIYQPEKNMLRVRVILKDGIPAHRFKDFLVFYQDNNTVGIEVLGDGQSKATAQEVKDRAFEFAINKRFMPQQKGKQAVSQMISNVQESSGSRDFEPLVEKFLPTKLPARSEVAENKTDEAGLPATKVEGGSSGDSKAVRLTGKKTSAVEKVDSKSKTEILKSTTDNVFSGISLTRIIYTLTSILAFSVLVLWGLKKWTKKYPQNENSPKIKVVTNHYLGPKKRLAIVRVAGESLLIGITDNNINLIKTLSLLDEELPDEVPHSFKGTLSHLSNLDEPFVAAGKELDHSRIDAPKTKLSEDDDGFALAGLNDIKDRISDRLKTMRKI